MNMVKKITRKSLQRRIRFLFSTKFKKSIAPRMAIAYHLREELNQLKIHRDDHLLFVMNTINQ
jgi:hypothetical protein